MEVTGSSQGWAQADVNALAVAIFKHEKADAGLLKEIDEASGGLVKSLFETGELKGKEGELSYLYMPATSPIKAKRLLLVGVGDESTYTASMVSRMAGTAVRHLRDRNVKSVALLTRSSASPDKVSEAASQGAIMSIFEMSKYRTVDKDEHHIEKVVCLVDGAEDKALKRGSERGRIIGEAVNFTRDMANEPGGNMTPSDMADRATEIAAKFGLSIDVLDESMMEQEGMGALLGVSRGSDEPAKLIVLKYTPSGSGSKSDGELLALIGKGITFDSGGISLKPGENMELMKYDMTGGATVIGVMSAIAQLKPKVPVLGVAACSENLPSGKATKPGDVLKAMSGKTIEVINTDAEGRLVLADAISYAKKLGATRIIDLATLTGAVSIALGDVNVAILGTDQDLIDQVISAGQEVGEKFWQLPLDKEYSKQIKSEIADIKNVGGRKAGTITAAAFLKEFADGTPWAHLDIAGTAWGDEAKPYQAKGPTGIAVRTLIHLVEQESTKVS